MAAGLAACGQTTGERAASGGLLGGAAGGALTGPGTVNLGRPA